MYVKMYTRGMDLAILAKRKKKKRDEIVTRRMKKDAERPNYVDRSLPPGDRE